MADLSGLIQTDQVQDTLDKDYEGRFVRRLHLGLSEIGNPCARYLWMAHRGLINNQPEGRILRLFELGNVIENALIKDLLSAGYEVWGQQQQVKIEFEGVTLFGHIDGRIKGLKESKQVHLLEIKTASKKSFNKINNSYQEWNAKYKAQIQVYMLTAKLQNALVVVYCKDDSRIYSERIKIDKDWIIGKVRDVFDIIRLPEMPGVCDEFWCDVC